MKPVREIIPDGAPVGIYCFDQRKPRFDHDYHHHPEVEITSIRSSEGQYLVGDATGAFRPRDVFIMGGNLPHRFKNWSDGVARSRVIQFREEIFGQVLIEREGFAGIRQLFATASRGLLIRGHVAAKADAWIDRVSRHKARPVALGDLLGLLEFLAGATSHTILCSPRYAPDLDSLASGRLTRVLAHIDRHSGRKLPLREIARVAALHPQSLSRFFRRHLGVTFQSHLVRTRIGHAARRLIESDDSVTEIAYASGFENMANFQRHFRRAHGTSPSLYRKQFR